MTLSIKAGQKFDIIYKKHPKTKQNLRKAIADSVGDYLLASYNNLEMDINNSRTCEAEFVVFLVVL